MSWYEMVSDMNQSYRSLATMDGRIGDEEESEPSDSEFTIITKADYDGAEGEAPTSMASKQPREIESPPVAPAKSEKTSKLSQRSATPHATVNISSEERDGGSSEMVYGDGDGDEFFQPFVDSEFMSHEDFKDEQKQSYFDNLPLESPGMVRSHTAGGTMYELPTEVVNELMKNFEDERAVLNL
eukprot:TRINITY_DN1282_c0_g1_i1.p1 TRINITY_DN1282_c0_g1~~TRINITY_DN1282_c0_g1_i1.p1  ORF type:complete len:184 (-),score=46.19 TRINITY_DN1282_c0_g1_i1:202-753(-)